MQEYKNYKLEQIQVQNDPKERKFDNLTKSLHAQLGEVEDSVCLIQSILDPIIIPDNSKNEPAPPNHATLQEIRPRSQLEGFIDNVNLRLKVINANLRDLIERASI